MKNPNRRNIWTALPVAGQQDINNFRADDATNLNLIKNLLTLEAIQLLTIIVKHKVHPLSQELQDVVLLSMEAMLVH